MTSAPSRPPSVDRVLKSAALSALGARTGRGPVLAATRAVLAVLRRDMAAGKEVDLSEAAVAALVAEETETLLAGSLKPVLNLTGTVLHTNLGRAPLAEEAIEAMARVARQANTLEFSLDGGGRGRRDDHVARRLCRLTGAQAALVVNNNAAALFLVLNTLANRRPVPVSRGEMIEIGDSFRLPDIMRRAGCRPVEVGTTNRTHLDDYRRAISPRTGLLLRCHRSNFVIEGFTAEAADRDLAALARGHGLPFVVDAGSGALIDPRRWGLPPVPTVGAQLAAGADLVAFSGDKLLGGPQAGLLIGRADLVAKLAANPVRRTLRADKLTLAALDATLALYEDPERLPRRLPALALLTREPGRIRAQAERLRAPLGEALGEGFEVAVAAMESRIGSGALPVDALPSAGLAVRPLRGGDRALRRLARRLRALPVPVLGRLRDGALELDLRCLTDEPAFLEGLARLTNADARP